jgi:hypothetical protein
LSRGERGGVDETPGICGMSALKREDEELSVELSVMRNSEPEKKPGPPGKGVWVMRSALGDSLHCTDESAGGATAKKS